MTRGSVEEYGEAVRKRYMMASRREKGEILDEFSRVTGYHRKAAIRLLGRGPGPPGRRRGRPRRYGPEVASALKLVWEAGDRLCSKRLKPFLPELVKVLVDHRELTVTPEVAQQLCRLSSSTIDRLLKPHKRVGGRRPLSSTKPGSLLKAAIPIRTFADWEEDHPGFLEIDLVAHCGESTEGFYLNTLSAVDVSTGWVESEGYGEKAKTEWEAPSAISPTGYLSLYWASTRTTAASSSITIYLPTARERGLPSPVPDPTRRTIAPTWSRRTGL